MPRIECKPCGKVWNNVGEYMKEHGCDSGRCPHRRQRPQLQAPETKTMRVDRCEGEVQTEESYDLMGPSYFLDVPKIIAMDIYPPGCRAKRKPMKAS